MAPGESLKMKKNSKTLWALSATLVMVPLIGNAQFDMGPDWPAVKQEMIELGLRSRFRMGPLPVL